MKKILEQNKNYQNNNPVKIQTRITYLHWKKKYIYKSQNILKYIIMPSFVP